jgi:broad specificity phosphatase PhoE
MKASTFASIAVASLLPLAAANAQQTVILVRHAELQGATAMAEPKELPLSDAGKARARRLAELLEGSSVAAIYVTDFQRTNQTGQPLSYKIDRPLTVVPKGDSGELVARMRKEHAGQTVLVVGHTDTLPGLIKALGYPAEIKIEPQDYGNVFIVTPKADGAPAFLRLRY